MDHTYKIREGTIEEAVAVSYKISEFHNPYSTEEYYKRLNQVPHLILIAEIERTNIGFKVGYERGSFFLFLDRRGFE